jgi:tetratricopeptide (TPR) repeat protein
LSQPGSSGDEEELFEPRRRAGLSVRGAATAAVAVVLVAGAAATAWLVPPQGKIGEGAPAGEGARGAAAQTPEALLLPSANGVFAVQGGKLSELKMVGAGSSPTPGMPTVRLAPGTVVFVVHDRAVRASVPRASLGIVARVESLYKLNEQGVTVSVSDLSPVEWVHRDMRTDLLPLPVPNQPEMVQYRASLEPGRFAFRIGNLIGDLLVEGAPVNPDHCVDRYESPPAGGNPGAIQYQPCSARTMPVALDLFMRGEAWAARGDLQRAIARFDDALRSDPKFLPALGMRAYYVTLVGDLDRAIADAGKAIDMILSSAGQNPLATPEAVSSVYGIRGLALFKKGDLARAAADIGESIRFNQRNAAAYEVRARISLRTGQLQHALQDAEQFVHLAPVPGAYQLRGEVYKALGRREEAIADFRRALSGRLPEHTRQEIQALLSELGAS